MKQLLAYAFLLITSLFILAGSVYSQSGWVQQNPSPQNERFIAVSFIDANTGTAVGISDNGGVILRTTNGGATWTNPFIVTSNPLTGGKFSDANTGTIVGDGGIILSTTNGGATWNNQSSGTTNELRGICFTDSSTGTAVGNSGTVLHTTNGGLTWSSQSSGTTLDFFGVSFTDARSA